jgi:2,4-dienoyl-CoA reductase-like NADH-dependent reductase (Old Yellow Enzyme family)
MSPMTRQFSPDGVPGEDVAEYYARRARNGVGLIVTEGVGVDHPSAIGQGTMGEKDIPVLHGGNALEGWRKVVESVHAAGGKIVPQLWHMGLLRKDGTPPYPEARSLGPGNMSEADITDVIAAFSRSAANAKAVGFDGIALHGGHGYLLDSFLWDQTNQRGDHWGGNAVLRMHFPAMVIKGVREAIGPDLPIIFRISQWKLQDYDAKLAEAPETLGEICRALASAGVDIFDVSTRYFAQPAFAGSDMGLAGWIRRLSGCPTMTVGGIGFDKELAASFTQPTAAIDNLGDVLRRFDSGEFDLVAIGRALLMDPDWVSKAKNGLPFKPFDISAYSRLG